MEVPIVLYDACVLFPSSLRDLLMRLAEAGVIRARWTDSILDETFNNILRHRPGLDPARLERTRRLMCEAIPDCLVTGYEPLIETLVLPDPGDRHVLAAALHCGASILVTSNLKDFPSSALSPHRIEALHPDDFVFEVLERAEGLVIQVLEEQAGALRNPPRSVSELLDILMGSGLARSVSRIRVQLEP